MDGMGMGGAGQRIFFKDYSEKRYLKNDFFGGKMLFLRKTLVPREILTNLKNIF